MRENKVVHVTRPQIPWSEQQSLSIRKAGTGIAMMLQVWTRQSKGVGSMYNNCPSFLTVLLILLSSGAQNNTSPGPTVSSLPQM